MDLNALHRSLKAAVERKQFERWRYFTPVEKQKEFFATGLSYPERLLMAGNRLGKTECAAYELSRHMTGEYPDWWNGKRYTKPVQVWAAGTSAEEVRNTIQVKLCGPFGDSEAFGSGFIPRTAFEGEPRASRSVTYGYEGLHIKHKSGGVSRLTFKTYEQERRHWQGAELDLIWFDEEPPLDIYTEGRTRLSGKGMSFMTFTPLFGMSDVVRRFVDEEDPLRVMVRYGIKDATFMPEEQKANLIAGYPAHEREQRMNGEPLFSEGRIFGTPEADLLEPEIPLHMVPRHWALLWGVDFGIAHPFAAVLYAWDRDEPPGDPANPRGPVGTVHILRAIRMRNAVILQHADAMKRIAPGVPVAWPHDGNQRDPQGGEPIAKIYRSFGLNMLAEHATHPTGGYSTEAGVADLDAYMQARQFRVNENLADWLQEYRQYHRKDGLIVKVHDDLMSATRIAHMMRRRAVSVPLTKKRLLLRPTQSERINPWTGRYDGPRTPWR